MIMKRIIAILLAALTVFAMCSCAKKENKDVEAIVDYYTNRYSMKDFTEDSIKYVGEDKETGRKEFAVKNEELDIDVTLYTEEWGNAVGVYDKDGIRIHIYNATVVEE